MLLRGQHRAWRKISNVSIFLRYCIILTKSTSQASEFSSNCNWNGDQNKNSRIVNRNMVNIIYMVNTAKSCPVTIDRTCKHTKTHYLGILLTNGNLAIWSSLGASTDNYMKVWQWKFLTVFHWSSYLHWSRSLMMPPENIRKPLVFWCFQEVSKEISGMKWVG